MKFQTLPYIFCDQSGGCDFAQRNDFSYWLSTPEPMPMMMTPIEGDDIKKFISR